MQHETKLKLIQELRSEVEVAKLHSEDALDCWNALQDDIARNLRTEDPDEFLCWYPYRKAIFVGNSSHIPEKLKFLQDSGRWKFWDKMLEDSGVGNPDRLPYFPKSTGSTVNNAYHLEKFYQATGRDVWSYDAIFEFGAGYGVMCRTIRKAGCIAPYAIYDLPVSLAFQRFYLAQHPYIDMEERVLLTSDLKYYMEVIKDLGTESKIFIGTMSFSEAPLAIRAPLYRNFKDFDAWLIAYAEKFYGVDNVNYFKGFSDICKEEGYSVFESEVDSRPGKKYFFVWRE